MACAIAVFAKTVGLSPVKTRLAQSIGVDRAEAFYRLSVSAIEETLQQVSDIARPHWVLAEEEAVQLPSWHSFPAMWTGEGGLGDRLAHVSETLFSSHDAVMFMGTDSPQLSANTLRQAIELVEAEETDCLAGPALDGGFNLFASRNPVPADIWKAVEYSCDTTLADLENRLQRTGRQVRRLSAEQDVDVVEDLERLKERLLVDRETLNNGQMKLLRWLEATIG